MNKHARIKNIIEGIKAHQLIPQIISERFIVGIGPGERLEQIMCGIAAENEAAFFADRTNEDAYVFLFILLENYSDEE